MTNPSEDLQAQFEYAWNDLAERLTSGADSLRLMVQGVQDAADKNRLLDKAAGVDYATEIWDDFNSGAMQRSGDYAGMWRNFTDQMIARLGRSGFQPGYYQGLYLALDYQRGYGADVDAPRPLPRTV